jgi:hypothetical protein
MPIKMLTVVGEEVFYSVSGVIVKTPNFLPKSYNTVDELNDILSRFDSSNICCGLKLPCKDALTPSLKKATMKQLCERRSKFCLRLLQKGSTCYRCEHLKKLVAGMSPKPSQMERLVEWSQKSSHQNRLLKLRLCRKQKVIQVKIVNYHFYYPCFYRLFFVYDLRQEIRIYEKALQRRVRMPLKRNWPALILRY